MEIINGSLIFAWFWFVHDSKLEGCTLLLEGVVQVRVCGDVVLRYFLVRFCGNFYFNLWCCSFKTLSSVLFFNASRLIISAYNFNSVVCNYGLFKLILYVINHFGQ